MEALYVGDVGSFAAFRASVEQSLLSLLTKDGSWVNALSIEVAGGYII